MNLIFSENTLALILIYLAIINLCTFFLFAFDKLRAGTVKRRVPEKTLLLIAVMGGTPAALIGMNVFRHKTKKTAFQLPLYLIMLAQIVLIVLIVKNISTTNQNIFF